MSARHGAGDAADSATMLHQAVELGITFFDAAGMHAQGANEALVGRELRAARNRVVIPKFANIWGPGGKRTGTSGKPDYVRSAWACRRPPRQPSVASI